MIKVKRALVSVFAKDGIQDLAAALKELGISVVSTGGTAKALREVSFQVCYVCL